MNVQPEVVKQWLQLTLLNPITPTGFGFASSDGGTSDFSALLQDIIAMLPGSGLAEQERTPAGLDMLGAGAAYTGMFGMTGSAVLAGSAGMEPSHSATAAGRIAGGRMAGLHKAASQTAWRYQMDGYDRIIAEASMRYGVETSLVKAVIHAESAYDPLAVSRAGAKGLMQLMDATAEWLGVTDPFDPRQNIFGGTRFLAQLLERYEGNEAVALAAYNAGPGRIDRLGITSDEELEMRLHELPRETQNYVRKVLELKRAYE